MSAVGIVGDAELAYRALLNILEDAAEERSALDDTYRAMVNIVDDALDQTVRVENGQRALVNILDDAAEERVELDNTHRAMLNILDDALDEKVLVENGQKALLNILDDLEVEKSRVETINTDLEGAIAEHRRAERELRERTDDLGRSNADLEMFAYAASHDLSEPLRAISVPITLLARRYEGQLDADAHELVGFAVDGCRRMQTLIDDLLAYSRVGRREADFAPVDLHAVAETVLASLGPAIADANATVTVDPLPVVTGETTQLTQVLQNLISNAVKFSKPGEALVHVSVAEIDGEYRFTVTDNGIGIEPQYRDRVFGLFKRLHGRDEYPGTGIGLAVAKKVVERHGGHIGVTDGPNGEGTCFWFTLPSAGGA